jgi:histidyl-tRNA synthetase
LPTQLFRFQDQGERDITLRPELTASLGRIAAGYQREYQKPLKWFEIGSCFRYEKPQKGRMREFYQFNADILGEATTGADGELISLAIDCMRELGFTADDFVVRVSDREAWLRFAADHKVAADDVPTFLGIVDKFERDRPEECQKKLDAFGISRDELVQFIENPPAGISPHYDELVTNLQARGLAEFVRLDLSIVRGLAYYTGLVFEIFDTSRTLRAVAGGGRYDELIAGLSDNAVSMPATGFAMGDAVITHLIQQTPKAKALMDAAIAASGCDLFVVVADEDKRTESLALTSALRDLGYKTDMPLSKAKVGAQFQRAERAGARYSIVVGRDYPQVELKNMAERSSEVLSTEVLFDQLAGLLGD